MTELEHIEIEGFKGLEHVEFEPSKVNIITGRNNTGKTSVLEAINLLFSPTEVQTFSDNIDNIILEGSNQGEIQAKTLESNIEVDFRESSKEDVVSYLPKILPELIRIQTSLLNLGFETETNTTRIKRELQPIIQRALYEKTSPRRLEQIGDTLIVVSVNGDEYPYFSIEALDAEVVDYLQEEINEAFLEEGDRVKKNEGSVIQDLFEKLREVEDMEEPRLGLAVDDAISGNPQNRESVKFIKSLSKDGVENAGKEDAVKIDDIEDYIKETGILDNLKSFDLDHLVFEDKDGNKYQVTYDFMGDGFRSIVSLLWELMDDDIENKIVLIEEPETHMHPGYIREVVYFLINLAREENVQLFITTHDSDFIDDFFTENLTDEEESYLEDEFSLLRMEEDSAVVEDYETARENLKDLHLDLRGI